MKVFFTNTLKYQKSVQSVVQIFFILIAEKKFLDDLEVSLVSKNLNTTLTDKKRSHLFIFLSSMIFFTKFQFPIERFMVLR